MKYVFATIIRRSGIVPTDFRTLSRLGYSHLLPPPGVGDFVRNLWLQSIDMNMSPGELAILNACPNIEQLATSSTAIRTLYASAGWTNVTRVDHGRPALWSLTLLDVTYAYSWHWLSDPAMKAAKERLSTVTHLRLVTMYHNGYVPLEHFPHLTHVAVPLIQTRDLWLAMRPVMSCDTLRMIVVAVSESDWLFRPWMFRNVVPPGADATSPREKFRAMAASLHARDERVFVALSPRHGRDLGAEWADVVRGGQSIWDRARDKCDVDALPASYPRPTLQYG